MGSKKVEGRRLGDDIDDEGGFDGMAGSLVGVWWWCTSAS